MDLSRMRENSLVRFFEGKAAVTPLTYSECKHVSCGPSAVNITV